MAKGRTALAVKRLRRPGVHAVGDGVYLQIRPEGSRTWIFRYMRNGRSRTMGLGSDRLTSLADIREQGRALRAMVRKGIDPIEHARRERSRQALAEARQVTFEHVAADYLDTQGSGWKNPKHRAQWRSTIFDHAVPVIGPLPIADINRADIVRVLTPLWQKTPETARRLRGRLAAILNFAEGHGLREGKNPAEWKTLKTLLPKQGDQDGHHAALPFAELPAFMEALRDRDGLGARALELAILTAARTGEVIGATWSEIDLAEKTWRVPAGRMKGGRPHRIPLADRALEILAGLLREEGNPHVFIGGRAGRPLSDGALFEELRRMNRGKVTVHGFRSTFRDWVAERTDFPGDVAELALAHAIASRVEASYRRGDLLDKRRKLMDAWDRFATSPAGGKVVAFPRG